MAGVSPKDGAKRAKAEMYRRLILDAAEQVFAEHGFDEAKMQDIAQAAGIALGTLYTVFPGKTELYGAIQEQRGREILEAIHRAIQGYEGVVDACRRGIDAYVRTLAGKSHFLRMHLREGLSWTNPSTLRSGEEVATWERGMSLAVSLLQAGIERGFLYGDTRPEVLLKMMVAAHQVQLQDWLDRGAAASEIDGLIERMQQHFVRAFVAAEAPSETADGPVPKPKKRISGDRLRG
ncbi:MAG: TetR family transcriptional regulator [Myxococcaceae bacterium]|nr:TetR family transcriptional regulator [Myxococcaceae bacterium]